MEKTEQTEISPFAVQGVLAALKEVQDTVRAYDTSPVDFEDRTPDLPVDRQMRFAVGAEYAWSPTMTIGGSFVYADFGDGEIDRTFLKGDYEENRFLFFGLYSKWRW